MFAGYRRKSHNFSLDRQVKPLVLPSEIMGLKNLTGYLKSEQLHRPDPVRTESRAADANRHSSLVRSRTTIRLRKTNSTN